MLFHLSAQALWAAGFIELAALFAVLVVRGRWRSFPVFTAWIGFQVLRTILLYGLYHAGTNALYSLLYWAASIVDMGVQIAIVIELARAVLKPTGTWVRDAGRMFLLLALLGVLIAALAAYGVNPKMPATPAGWIGKGSLFAAMLNAQLFAAMAFASTRLGLAWRHHVMAIATGWSLWAIIGLFVEAAYSYFGPQWKGLYLDQVRVITYQFVTIYWTINLWLPEPVHRTLSPEMQSYLSGLQYQARLGVQAVSNLDRS